MIDIEELRLAFHYDRATGHLTYARARQNAHPGARAGHLHKDGYRRVRYMGKTYREHRVIFAIVEGRWPAAEVDHDNNIRDDNRWLNLREATPTQNRQNQIWPNQHGAKGIDFHKPTGKWRARIHIAKGKRKYLGSFDTPEAAHAAYKAAAEKLHGEFARTEPAYLD